MVMDGNGQRDGDLAVMDGVAMDGDRRQWMAMDSTMQLDIKGWRDSESTAMGDNEQYKHDGNVSASGGGSNKRKREIKT